MLFSPQLVIPTKPAIIASGSLSAAWVANQSDASAAASVITYAAASLGADVANRVVVVAVANRASTGSETISSVTIGGVTATPVTGSFLAGGASALMSGGIFYATGVSGTSGDVVVTWSGNVASSMLSVYNVITATPTPTFGDSVGGPGTGLTKTLTVPASGYGIGMYGQRNGSGAVTWTNATRDFQAVANARTWSSAHATASASVTAVGDGSLGDVLLLAAWGP